MMSDFSFSSNPVIQELERIRQEQIDESSSNLQSNLIYFNLIIFILSSALSYYFARRTLMPIEQSMEAQNRFAADASHELRTPLTVMRSEIEVALRDNKFNLSDAKKLLNSNLEETAKLESLSKALLKLARLDHNPRADFKRVSIVEVIKDAFEKVEKLADQKSINIVCHTPKDKSNMKLRGDRESLVELMVILLDNAIRYSPKKSKIEIITYGNEKMVEIRIVDQGIGIDQSDIGHIFDRFYRADQSRNKDNIDGYGLGLSIAKSIVDLHGGTILAKSSLGEGSEFVFTLPSSQ